MNWDNIKNWWRQNKSCWIGSWRCNLSQTFELVTSNLEKIVNANLVITDGLGLESRVEKAVDEYQKSNSKLQILKLGDNIINPDRWIFDYSFPKDEGDPNPDLWLNDAYAMKFAILTRNKLIEMILIIAIIINSYSFAFPKSYSFSQ